MPHAGSGPGTPADMWYGGEYTPHSVRVVTVPEAAYVFDTEADARRCADVLIDLGQADHPVVERARVHRS